MELIKRLREIELPDSVLISGRSNFVVMIFKREMNSGFIFVSLGVILLFLNVKINSGMAQEEAADVPIRDMLISQINDIDSATFRFHREVTYPGGTIRLSNDEIERQVVRKVERQRRLLKNAPISEAEKEKIIQHVKSQEQEWYRTRKEGFKEIYEGIVYMSGSDLRVEQSRQGTNTKTVFTFHKGVSAAFKSGYIGPERVAGNPVLPLKQAVIGNQRFSSMAEFKFPLATYLQVISDLRNAHYQSERRLANGLRTVSFKSGNNASLSRTLSITFDPANPFARIEIQKGQPNGRHELQVEYSFLNGNIPFVKRIIETAHREEKDRLKELWKSVTTISEIKLNVPIKDETFDLKLPVGTRVIDQRYSPPVSYVVQSHDLESLDLQIPDILKEDSANTFVRKKIVSELEEKGFKPSPLAPANRTKGYVFVIPLLLVLTPLLVGLAIFIYWKIRRHS